MKTRNTATITIVFTDEEQIKRVLAVKEVSKLNYREIFMNGVEKLELDIDK